MLAYPFCRASEGEASEEFEQSFKEYIGTPYAITMPSARLGLFLILKYLSLPEDSEIIISPFTHWSIFAVIKMFRLKPVFVDIDEHTCNIDPQATKRVINKNTKLIILTHMWGQACEMGHFMDLKKRFDIKIIEDCAMACGATYINKKVGSFGDASIFSFGKAKAIAAFGGGMLCTNDKGIGNAILNDVAAFHYEHPGVLFSNVFSSIAANILTRPQIFFLTIYPIMRIFHIRDPYNPIEHKKDVPAFFKDIPEQWKVRMSDLQAVVAMEQLKNLDYHNRKRRENAQILNTILRGSNGIAVPISIPEVEHIYLYYVLLVKKKTRLDDIRSLLIRHRIDTQLNELTTSKELEVFGANSMDYPIFNRVSSNLLILPNGIYLDRNDISFVGNTVKTILDSIV